MAHKIFVSYKYNDSNVFPLGGALDEVFNPTTVRSYVDIVEKYFNNTGSAIYKGESDDEDLSYLGDDEIWENLKERIFDSSLTVIMISPNMRNTYRSDRSQWIPWEISFSLKETTRNDRTSRSNALLAIVLPDKENDYSYCIEPHCYGCKEPCQILTKHFLFDIIEYNMYNKIKKTPLFCDKGYTVYSIENSYIKCVKWDDFTRNPNIFISEAINTKDHIDEYKIRKEL